MKIVKMLLALSLVIFLFACGSNEGDRNGSDAATSDSKDKAIRNYNLDVEKDQAKNRFPCDTIALQQYILDSYPAGSYLVDMAKTFTYTLPKPAVLYYKGDRNYIFAVIAQSKRGERNIETKNIVGYESSFINLDSTKLGTAFFWLTLFQCDGEGNFTRLWESEVPSHGGFASMALKTWRPKNIQYIQLYFMDGIISGHRDYNFFMVDGITKPPHLLETYEGIAHKRTMADVNHDSIPDYYEYRFADSTSYIRQLDSIPFFWSDKKQLYITNTNKRWFRKY